MSASGMNFTDKATAALGEAQDLAQQYAHSQLLPIHLAVALYEPQPDLSKDQKNAPPPQSLFKQVLERAHGDPQLFDRALKKAMVRLPSQDPPPDNVSVSPQFSKV